MLIFLAVRPCRSSKNMQVLPNKVLIFDSLLLPNACTFSNNFRDNNNWSNCKISHFFTKQ